MLVSSLRSRVGLPHPRAGAIAVVLAVSLSGTVWAQSHTSPIQVTTDGSSVWVVNPDHDSVARIDAASETLVDEYPVGDNPRNLALDDASGWVYVANQGSQDLTPKPNPETVMRLDQTTGAVQQTFTLPFGCAPYGVIVRPTGGGNQVYVSCERTQRITLLDEDLSTIVAEIELDWPDPRSMALSADGTRLYVAHFLTREPGTSAHVSEIDTTTAPPSVIRVLEIPADLATCETINSGIGAFNLLAGIHLTPAGSTAEVANQLWVGGVMQSNIEKGLFLRDERFGGKARPLLCVGGDRDGKPCETEEDCEEGKGECLASFSAISRNLYKASFHDITRFAIFKLDLGSGDVVGKIDVDEANQGTDLVFSADGTTAYVVDQFFNSFHIFNTKRGQDGNPTTLFASVSARGPGGADPNLPCTGESFDTTSETPFRFPPQCEITPIRGDALFVGGTPANTGNDYLVTTGQMQKVPDGIGTVPHGIAVHPSGTKVYVANFLSRNVISVKVDGFFCSDGSPCQTNSDCSGRCFPRANAVIESTNTPDPLTPQLLDGKILFHTAARDSSLPNSIGLGNAAPRFNLDDPTELEPVGLVTSTSHDASYVACISCHPEGGFDGRSWDFSQFGASIRNTMDLRGRASFAPGICSDDPNTVCVIDSQCTNNGVGICSNDPNTICELDIQCGECAAASPTPGVFCIANRQCGGVCSQDDQIDCSADGDCGGVCNEDPNEPCQSNEDCLFGCAITNTCDFFECETTSCNAAKCRPTSLAEVPLNITDTEPFFNPMLTVHWNADRDEVEDFEFTFRSLMGAGDCDGVEHLPDRCIGALVMRSNVAKPQEANPDLGEGNRGLSPRLDHMADYVYSLTEFVPNPNLDGGPSSDASAGREIFNSSLTRCAECHNGPSSENQHFTDKAPLDTHPFGQQGGPDVNNPFLRHNVGTFNQFDLTDPFLVASDIGQFQNAVLPIPASRGPLVDYVTPAIVDVWNTGPYNHDGGFASLLQGLLPCDSGLDDCSTTDVGKNIDDQHGTTTNLTPQQIQLLVEFLRAPHGPIGSGLGSFRAATALGRPLRAKIKFRDLTLNTDDRFDIKANVTFPADFVLDLAKITNARGKLVTVLDEVVTITLMDVDGEPIERTVPAQSLVANSKQTKFRYKDKTATVVPGIRKVELKLLKTGPRDYRIKVQARDMDLSTLDKNHIQLAVSVGDDGFVRTRTFDQNSKRSTLKLKEK